MAGTDSATKQNLTETSGQASTPLGAASRLKESILWLIGSKTSYPESKSPKNQVNSGTELEFLCDSACESDWVVCNALSEVMSGSSTAATSSSGSEVRGGSSRQAHPDGQHGSNVSSSLSSRKRTTQSSTGPHTPISSLSPRTNSVSTKSNIKATTPLNAHAGSSHGGIQRRVSGKPSKPATLGVQNDGGGGGDTQVRSSSPSRMQSSSPTSSGGRGMEGKGVGGGKGGGKLGGEEKNSSKGEVRAGKELRGASKGEGRVGELRGTSKGEGKVGELRGTNKGEGKVGELRGTSKGEGKVGELRGTAKGEGKVGELKGASRGEGNGTSKGEGKVGAKGGDVKGGTQRTSSPSVNQTQRTSSPSVNQTQRTSSPSVSQSSENTSITSRSSVRSSKKKGILVGNYTDSSSTTSTNHSAGSLHSVSSSNGSTNGAHPTSHSNGHVPSSSNSRLHSVPETTTPKENGTSQAEKSGEKAGGSAFEKVMDTLRINRPKKKKKGKKLAYSIVVDPSQIDQSQITTPGENLNRYEDPFETSFAENGEPEKKFDHVFKAASIPHNKPEYCDHCGDMAWGLYRQVLKCSSKYFL